ncbi:MAG: hypothetical protein U1E36_09080 [Rickettsiales bacterium]
MTADNLETLLTEGKGISYAGNPMTKSCHFTVNSDEKIDDLDTLGRAFIRAYPGALRVSLDADKRHLTVAADSKEIFDQLQALAKRSYN